jgi:hypothetical protein
MNLHLSNWQYRQLAVLALVLLCSLLPHHLPDPPMAMYALRGVEGVALAVLLGLGFRAHWATVITMVVFEGSVTACAWYTNEGAIARARGMCDAQTGLPVSLLALSWAFLAIAIILRDTNGGAK